MAPKRAQKCPCGGWAVHAEIGFLFWSFLLWGPLGAPVEHRVPKSHSRSSKMSPKMDEKHRKVTSKYSKHNPKTPEYGYQVLLKKSKQNVRGHSALYFMLFWCSDFRQSMDTSF